LRKYDLVLNEHLSRIKVAQKMNRAYKFKSIIYKTTLSMNLLTETDHLTVNNLLISNNLQIHVALAALA